MAKDVKDKIFMGPDFGNGTRPFVRVKEKNQGLEVSAGSASFIKDNTEPESGTVAYLKHLGGDAYEVKKERPAGSGPCQVSSDAYRKGWDGIFGKKIVGQA